MFRHKHLGSISIILYSLHSLLLVEWRNMHPKMESALWRQSKNLLSPFSMAVPFYNLIQMAAAAQNIHWQSPASPRFYLIPSPWVSLSSSSSPYRNLPLTRCKLWVCSFPFFSADWNRYPLFSELSSSDLKGFCFSFKSSIIISKYRCFHIFFLLIFLVFKLEYFDSTIRKTFLILKVLESPEK